MTSDNAAACLRALAQAGFRYVPDLAEGTVAIWADTLRDVTVQTGRETVLLLARETSDFPTPAEFRQRAKALQRESEQVRKALPSPDGSLYSCKCGPLAGWVLVDVERDSYRPCAHCNLERYTAWAAGEWAPRVFARAMPDGDALESNRSQLAAVKALLKEKAS